MCTGGGLCIGVLSDGCGEVTVGRDTDPPPVVVAVVVVVVVVATRFGDEEAASGRLRGEFNLLEVVPCFC